MRKSLLAAIMAASALVPAAAMAQDNPDRPHREGEARPEGRPAAPKQAPQPQRQAPPVQAHVQAGAAVQAQPQVRPDRGGRPDFRGQPQGQPQQGRGPGNGAPYYGGGPRDGHPDVNGGSPRGGDPRVNGGYRPDARGYDGHGYDGRGYDHRGGYNPNVNRGGGAWSRDWRHDNRYNYNVYRNQNRSAYHLPRYYAPHGWAYGYRRFAIGYTLNSILFDQNYWIGDPGYYRLPPAYGPYRWVRYYNDALLVDIRSGYVVDTVYDIFW